MREISVSAVDEGQRLDKYLAKYMPEAAPGQAAGKISESGGKKLHL